jgi:cysteine desulfurase
MNAVATTMNERVYLDWNATAPLRPQARVAVTAALDLGNPSSVHGEGRAARRAVEEARAQIAALINAQAAGVIFTSGGTEANMLALAPAVTSDGAPCDCLLVSAIEHPSVRAGGRFRPELVEEIPVTPDGVVDLAVLEQRLIVLAGKDVRPFVSIMLANNETGVIQPVQAACELVHRGGGLMHVDAVQAVGRIPCDFNALGADLLTISAHKLGGPKGVGALVRREAVQLDPLITGGGQERNQRAGTENVAGIAGFGAEAAAARTALEPDARRMAALRDRLEAGLQATAPKAVIFGAAAERLPNTTLFTVPGLKAETAVIALDLEGIAVSSGAACSSGKVQPSHVLAAMGVDQALARGAIRLSLGWTTTEADIARALDAWRKLSRALLKESRGLAA